MVRAIRGVELGVGLAAEHLDLVTEVDERLGQVACVHALAADVRLAPVREVGDRQGPFRPGRHSGQAIWQQLPPGKGTLRPVVPACRVRAVVQRVTEAAVTVAGEDVGRIGRGLCVLVGVTHDDDEAVARTLADRLFNIRLFDDEAGVMNRSAADVGAAILVVSQFTLYGDTTKGRRPSWIAAARPTTPSRSSRWWWTNCAGSARRLRPDGSAPRCWSRSSTTVRSRCCSNADRRPASTAGVAPRPTSRRTRGRGRR